MLDGVKAALGITGNLKNYIFKKSYNIYYNSFFLLLDF